MTNKTEGTKEGATPASAATFQQRMDVWLLACFGEQIARDKVERNHRFLEESLELVQALGCTADEAHQLVDYTFGRPAGEPRQEVGGVVTTLAALCQAQGIDMMQAAEAELARIWTKVEQIRAKQAAKPKGSPLPAASAVDPAPASAVLARRARDHADDLSLDRELDHGETIRLLGLLADALSGPGAAPAAYVPIHPRNGPLWSMTTAEPSPERLPNNYPLRPVYFAPEAVAPGVAQDAARYRWLRDQMWAQALSKVYALPILWGVDYPDEAGKSMDAAIDEAMSSPVEPNKKEPQ